MYKYKHHNTSFLIDTSEILNHKLRLKVEYAIADFFDGFLKSETDDFQFQFIITDNINDFIVDSYFKRVKDVKIGDTQIHFLDNELNILINNKNPFSIIVGILDNETIFSSLRVFNKAFKNNIEQQISTFYYRIFLLFSQLWNIQNNLSYLHSSAISLNNKSIIFTASSGVGKSSLLIKLSQNREISFIADDLTVVSSNSRVFYQGRSISIKPYHLKYDSFLKKKIKSLMSMGQKLQWNFLRDNRLTYRLPASELFADISESADIKKVIHLCNHSGLDFKIADMSLTDLVNSNTSILINELFLANHKLNTLASFSGSPFENSSIIYKRVSEIYLQAFKDVEIKQVFIPYMSNPKDLYNFLKSEECLS